MPWDPVRGQKVMQELCREGRGDMWGTRSTSRAHSSAGHLPFLVPLLAELPNSCFEAQKRTGDRHGWRHKAWTPAQTYPESTARTEAASSFPQEGPLCCILVAKTFFQTGKRAQSLQKGATPPERDVFGGPSAWQEGLCPLRSCIKDSTDKLCKATGRRQTLRYVQPSGY